MLLRWAVLGAAAATLFAAEQGRKDIPAIYAGGVVNAASFVPAPDNFVAPGSIVSIFGDDLALRTRAATGRLDRGRLPLELGGVQVRVGGQLAPLFFVSPGQINLQIPASLAARPQPWTVVVVREGLNSPAADGVHVRATAPGLFPVIAHADFTLVGRGDPEGSFPAKAGETVILFGTGFGPTDPPVVEGQLPTFIAPIVLPHRIFLNGQELPANATYYIGQAPGLAGLQQVNLTLPAPLDAGDYEVVVEVSGAASQPGVLIAVD